MVVGKFQNIKANTMVSTLFIYYLQFQILYCISVAFMHLIVSFIYYTRSERFRINTHARIFCLYCFNCIYQSLSFITIFCIQNLLWHNDSKTPKLTQW